MTAYQPTPVDLAWANNVVRMLVDGGATVFPSSGLHYVIDKVGKYLTLQNPELLADPARADLHEKTIATFAAIGWKVITGEPR